MISGKGLTIRLGPDSHGIRRRPEPGDARPTAPKTGIIATILVPSRPLWILRLPPNCRRRARMPATPTPNRIGPSRQCFAVLPPGHTNRGLPPSFSGSTPIDPRPRTEETAPCQDGSNGPCRCPHWSSGCRVRSSKLRQLVYDAYLPEGPDLVCRHVTLAPHTVEDGCHD